MSHQPKKIVPLVAALLALASGVGGLAADGDTVVSPAKRTEGLDRAKKFLAPREIKTVSVDPFHPEAFAEAAAGAGRVGPAANPAAGGEGSGHAVTPAGPRTGRDLVQAIAASLKPGGYIVIGGQPSLSFGQKRVKPGGLLTITFEGTEYTVEITAIDRTNFTLRLNGEEFTRTIK